MFASTTGDIEPIVNHHRPVPVNDIRHATAVATDSTTFCVVDGGAVRCSRQARPGNHPEPFVLVTVTGIDRATDVVLDSGFGCALQDGGVWCWWATQEMDRLEAEPIPAWRDARALTAGGSTVCAIVGDDHLVSCLIRGGDEAARTPVFLAWADGATALARHHDGLCALAPDGAVRCTPGLEADAVPETVVPPVPGDPVEELAGGRYAICARLRSGAVRCHGLPVFGVLGDGAISQEGDNEIEPYTATVHLAGAAEIAAGWSHVCARVDAVIHCWGGAFGGALGLGPSVTGAAEPRPVELAP
jgi:hypothetical protein